MRTAVANANQVSDLILGDLLQWPEGSRLCGMVHKLNPWEALGLKIQSCIVTLMTPAQWNNLL